VYRPGGPSSIMCARLYQSMLDFGIEQVRWRGDLSRLPEVAGPLKSAK